MAETAEKILLDAGSSGPNGAHGTEDAMRCLQLYALKHRLHVEFGEKDNLVRGSIGHVGLAHKYARLWALQNGEDADLFYDPETAIRMEAAKPKHGSLGQKFLSPNLSAHKFYNKFYEKEKLEVLSVEEVLSIDIAKKKGSSEFWSHTQRLDLGVRERDGKVYFYDHKFQSQIDKRSLKRYTLSAQFLGYSYMGKRFHGREFGGVKVNLISMSDFTFDRVQVDPAPESERTFEIMIREARERVEKYEGTPILDWPKSNGEQICNGIYGACDAYNVCQWGAIPKARRG